MSKGKNKKRDYAPSPYALKDAIIKGNWMTKLSMLLCGFGCLMHKQIVKGIVFLAVEVAFIWFMVSKGFGFLAGLPGLGESEQGKVWNEALGVFEYSEGDNSVLILLYGVATCFVVLGFLLFWVVQLKQAYKLECYQVKGKHINSLAEDFKSLVDQNLHITLMALPCLAILLFNIVPLVFMISMAFTNYSKQGKHLILFDWVGLKNFITVLNMNGSLGKQFWSVLGWTLVWAVFATFLNYLLGMILAMIINRKGTKLKAMWRFFFVLSIAVPQFVSLLIMRTMLQDQGAINVMLQSLGITHAPIHFMTDPTLARITVIVVNLWVGIPYTLLQVTGILQNIPVELYEAAKVDGAGPATIFFKITLPYMLFVTTPYLITQFTGNVNNFNVIYLLSGGGPTPVGASAGKTDLLVTWLYKLTVDQQYYNIGAVIGIFTFVILSVVALVTYRNSGSYKNEEAFM